MKNIAVLFHGQLRFWKQANTVFSYWNSNNKNLNFEFFLSTWNEDKKSLEEDTVIKLEDYSTFSTDEMYNIMAPPQKNYFENLVNAQGIPCYQHYYAFHVTKVCDLLEKSNKKYDAVLIMRPDIFVFEELFQFFEDKFNFSLDGEVNNTEEFGANVMYSLSGTDYCQNSLFCSKDTLFVTSVEGIKKYGNMFNDIFVHQFFPPYTLHRLQAEYANWNKIYMKECSLLNHKLIRPLSNIKRGWPSLEGIEELISEYGQKLYSRLNTLEIGNIFAKYPIIH